MFGNPTFITTRTTPNFNGLSSRFGQTSCWKPRRIRVPLLPFELESINISAKYTFGSKRTRARHVIRKRNRIGLRFLIKSIDSCSEIMNPRRNIQESLRLPATRSDQVKQISSRDRLSDGIFGMNGGTSCCSARRISEAVTRRLDLVTVGPAGVTTTVAMRT